MGKIARYWVLGMLVGCGPPLEFDGSWSCEEKTNRPAYTYDATTVGPEIDVVFVEPIFQDLVGVGSIELEPRKKRTKWTFTGKLPRINDLSLDLGLVEVGWVESCDDVTSVLFEVVYPDGTDADFEVKKRTRNGGGGGDGESAGDNR